MRVVQTATTRILRHRFPGASETVGQVFKFVWRLHSKINAVCMSLSPLVSFKSRFVTYLLNFPRMYIVCLYLGWYQFTSTVSNPRPARLYYVARSHILKCCIHYKYYIILSLTNKMQSYTIFFITANDLHVSGGFSAHHQELKTVHTASGICQACLLLPLVVAASKPGTVTKNIV